MADSPQLPADLHGARIALERLTLDMSWVAILAGSWNNNDELHEVVAKLRDFLPRFNKVIERVTDLLRPLRLEIAAAAEGKVSASLELIVKATELASSLKFALDWEEVADEAYWPDHLAAWRSVIGSRPRLHLQLEAELAAVWKARQDAEQKRTADGKAGKPTGRKPRRKKQSKPGRERTDADCKKDADLLSRWERWESEQGGSFREFCKTKKLKYSTALKSRKRALDDKHHALTADLGVS